MPRLFAKKLATATFMAAVAGGTLVIAPATAMAAEPLSATAATSSLAPTDDRHRHRHCDSEEFRKIKVQYSHDHERRRAILRERGCPDD